MAKKFLSILLVLVLVLGLLPAAGAAALSTSPTFSDMPDNWATEALESAVANGLLVGDDGKIMPDSPLTRAQMATIIARAFGATEEGDISVYADVKSTDWFAVSMAKAYKMGVMQGYAGKMDPNSNITREQAFAVLARALKLEPASAINKTFEDEGEISDWAKGEVYALVNAGYIQGSNGRLNPQANISRAEFAQMMHNLIKQYIKAEGEYTQVADGNIMVNVPNVTLKNVTITGDLIVGDGVGDGDLILDNVTIKGRLLARGGGANSIIIIGGSVEGKVVVAKVDGNIRVSVEGGADVEVIVINDGKDDVIIEGTVGTVEVTAPDVPVIIQNATISKINVNCEGSADITVAETGSVTNVVVGDNSEGTAINVEGNITNIETSAPDTGISGTGVVGTVTANEGADNTSVTTPNTVVNNEGASGVTAGGGKEVPKDSSATNNSQGTDVITTPPSSGEPSYVGIDAITVNESLLLVKADENEPTDVRTIVATVSPANASNKRVTWSSSDETVATVDDNGVVTGITGGTATITVTSVADTTKMATVHVVVGDLLVPAGGSIQAVIDAAKNGQVIAVAPAEYKEQLVIDKPLTLLGPNADIAGYSENRIDEAIVTYSEDVTDTRELLLLTAYTDDITVKGFSFENHTVNTTHLDGTYEVYFNGENILFENNKLLLETNKAGLKIRGLGEEDALDGDYDYTGAVVRGNYIEGLNGTSNTVYIQGIGGIVEENVIVSDSVGIQVQPYSNLTGGIVQNNKISAYWFSIWHNSTSEGDAEWMYASNNITVREPLSVNQYIEKYGNAYQDIFKWYGIRIYPSSPNIQLLENTFDGSTAFDSSGLVKDKWIDIVGIQFYTGLTEASIFNIEDNTVSNVTIGVMDDAGRADLDLILAENTFPEGFNVLGNQIKMLEDGKIYISNTGVEYATIQAAIDAATAGDTILLGSGEYKIPWNGNVGLKLYKSLNIIGEDENSVVIRPETKGTPTTHRLIQTGYDQPAAVTLKNITIDGNLTDGSNGGVSRGINVYNYGAGLGSSLSLENVTIQNIIDDSVHDTTGLYFLTGGNATSSIKNVTIKNYGWTGVLIGSLVGDGDQIINIDGLHIDGRNDKNYLTNGLDIRGSSYRNLTIDANHVYIENCDYIDDNWEAFAILVSPEAGHYGSENVCVSLSLENSIITNSANALHFESSGRADNINVQYTIFDLIANLDLVWFGPESVPSSSLTVNQSYSDREGSINYLISSEDLDSENIGYDPIIYLPEITNSFNNAEYPTSDFGKDTMSFTLSNIYN